MFIDGFVKCPATSFPFNLRHCGVLAVRLIPQVSGASHLNILLYHPMEISYDLIEL